MSDNETVILDFEKTIVDIEEKIQHLKMIAKDEDLDITKEINCFSFFQRHNRLLES